MDRAYLLEACVDSPTAAVDAVRKGADRLELCSRLDLDGLTPEDQLIEKVIEATGVPVKVMLRLRPGTFEFDSGEQIRLKERARQLKSFPVAGIVFGAVKGNGLDIDLIRSIAGICAPVPLTVHKAIDTTADPLGEAIRLRNVRGVRAVLTSGGASTAVQGAETIRQIARALEGSIEVIAAGKITSDNLQTVHRLLQLREYHGRRIAG